jgi:AraC-like DNA-binding protein
VEVILWSIVLGFAILATALVVSLYYRHKYDPIFNQLSELLADKELGVTDKTNEPTERTNKPTDKPTDSAMDETAEEDKFNKGLYEIQFSLLTDTIRNEQLYTMPKFGRSDMIKHFHMSGKRISTLFSMAGTSVPEFIRECRLEHARQLMDERPEMTLVEIAAASGFVHASTFTTDFKKKYGVSPTKYREMKTEK